MRAYNGESACEWEHITCPDDITTYNRDYDDYDEDDDATEEDES